MPTERRQIVEAILFLPAMALLAALIGGVLYSVIVFGGMALTGIYGALRAASLPHPAALALAVMLAALVVFVVVPRLISAIGDLIQSRKA